MPGISVPRLIAGLGGPIGLAAAVILIAVGVPGLSLWLDYRTCSAQAKVTELKAFPSDDPSQNLAKLKLAEARQNRAERLQRLDFLQRLEWGTYDWRFSLLRHSTSSVSQVGLVVADDFTIDAIGEGRAVPEPYDLFWPRWPVLGRALRELRAEGASGVGFDWLMQELQRGEGRAEADNQFARELSEPGAPALLAIAPQQIPAPLFQFYAAGLGDVSATKDADSVSRRVRAYTDFRQFNPKLGYLANAYNWILKLEPNNSALWLQTNANGDAGRKILVSGDGKVKVPFGKKASITQTVPLMVTNRVWHLGLALAAPRLGVDLSRSGIEGHELHLKSTNGSVIRRLPVDDFGYFRVNWTLDLKSRNENGLAFENLVGVLQRAVDRAAGAIVTNVWTNRLVVIGSMASANNLRDIGPTPLGSVDFLVGTHLNVTEMALTGEVLRTLSFGWVALVMVTLSGAACAMTWKLRDLSFLGILAFGLMYFTLAVWVFVALRLVLPIAHPLVAGLLFPYGAMVTARAAFEQRERKRIRSVFAKMVSPDIVHEMLDSGGPELRGVRRELSVFFADVRGFTALTDRTQLEAENYVESQKLTGAEAEAYYDARAHEILDTVNLYLGALADVVKFHQGTLDKYIGDCVMAFWGAPTPNPRHAVHCVIAAIDAQRLIARLAIVRAEENDRRHLANVPRLARGEPALPLLPILAVGTGVNTGVVTVGLMGSDAHIVNYTVFGREVNLAARLEGISGHARIVIGEATFRSLERFAPALALVCQPLEPVAVKGFRAPVKVYEVRWQEAVAAAAQSLPLYEATPVPAFVPLPELSAKPVEQLGPSGRGPSGGGD